MRKFIYQDTPEYVAAKANLAAVQAGIQQNRQDYSRAVSSAALWLAVWAVCSVAYAVLALSN